MTRLEKKDRVIEEAAFALVDKINKLLEVDVAKNCATLELHRIEDVFGFSSGNLERRSGDPVALRFLSITVETLPGNALFRAKIREVNRRGQNSTFDTVGDITRINRYGNQSACVQNSEEGAVLKQFCYCQLGTTSEPVEPTRIAQPTPEAPDDPDE